MSPGRRGLRRIAAAFMRRSRRGDGRRLSASLRFFSLADFSDDFEPDGDSKSAFPGTLSSEVIKMSPKELLYVEDALGHEQILRAQCQQAVNNLTDPDLKNLVQQMMQKHQELFTRFYNLV